MKVSSVFEPNTPGLGRAHLMKDGLMFTHRIFVTLRRVRAPSGGSAASTNARQAALRTARSVARALAAEVGLVRLGACLHRFWAISSHPAPAKSIGHTTLALPPPLPPAHHRHRRRPTAASAARPSHAAATTTTPTNSSVRCQKNRQPGQGGYCNARCYAHSLLG